jgi:putative PIG3 family NAD(P)H quinone oxidoreductase
MKAVTIPTYGGPEVLELRELPDPSPATGEVLVRVRATALNRADIMQRLGRYPAPQGSSQLVPGMEYAGEIVALGDGVEGWRTGERVFGIVAAGGHAELVTAHASTLARVPDALSWEQAAAIPEAFITAHDALVTQGTLAPGEHVMVHAVGSGVGLAVAQVARALGARVFGTARSAEKLERAREYGMDAGIVAGADLGAVTAAAREWSGGGIDVIIDLVGGAYVPAGIAALRLRGRLVVVGLVAGRDATVSLGDILSKRLTIRGTALRSRTTAEKAEATRLFARDVLPLIASGAIRPVIDRVLPLERIREAHEAMQRDETFGKIVLLT